LKRTLAVFALTVVTFSLTVSLLAYLATRQLPSFFGEEEASMVMAGKEEFEGLTSLVIKGGDVRISLVESSYRAGIVVGISAYEGFLARQDSQLTLDFTKVDKNANLMSGSELTIYLSEQMTKNCEIEVDTVSGTLHCNINAAKSLTVNTISMLLEVNNLNAERLRVKTVAGSAVTIKNCQLGVLQVEAGQNSVNVEKTAAKEIIVKTLSGQVSADIASFGYLRSLQTQDSEEASSAVFRYDGLTSMQLSTTTGSISITVPRREFGSFEAETKGSVAEKLFNANGSFNPYQPGISDIYGSYQVKAQSDYGNIRFEAKYEDGSLEESMDGEDGQGGEDGPEAE